MNLAAENKTNQFGADKVEHLARIAALAEQTISFGHFLLLPKRRLLLSRGKPLRLGSRAFDILIALVEHPGELVSKDELMARVWPNTFVEIANLTVHVSALRRALGDGRRGNRYLINIPGRGYRFVVPVFSTGEPIPAPANGTRNLSVPVTKLAADAEPSRSLAMRLPEERFASGLGGASEPPPGTIEIEFSTGARMRFTGPVDASTIGVIVTALAKAKRW